MNPEIPEPSEDQDLQEVTYGKGLKSDLQTFFRDSETTQTVLQGLDATEKFALLGYFVLRKTEKQLADLVGLNECRFKQFLENTMQKVGALILFGGNAEEIWDEILSREGMGETKARTIDPEKPTRAGKGTKTVRTADATTLFVKTRSFLETGKLLGVYYVDVRRGMEETAESLLKIGTMQAEVLGKFLQATVQFAGVQNGAYAGKMGRSRDTETVKDPSVFGEKVIRIEDSGPVLTSRATGAAHNRE